ncbi:Periplasmic [NiFe] hydrogenase, small subunit [Desulfonema limicola]|uniref:Periplasmic [NiFe] hydrogenase, small subunit n=1 Tax=Desulfonema limicola TaxID=45656 RepID=A0A975GEN9_9BACT|nr:zinc-ribbon domain-containing protein [Desulfonema limicola]QTA78330.1 Periplasmic [NiFe] hydrogenase, small subunit [Desulfonema limicola]
MKIICEKCGFTMNLDKSRIPEKGAKGKCPKCRHIFTIKNPGTGVSDNANKSQKTLYWLQGGGCGGDTWAFFNSEPPETSELINDLNIRLLWHPSISNHSIAAQNKLNNDLLSGKQALDILCIEGSIIRGPGGTGMFDTLLGKPKKDIAASLANKASYVLAVGTCASFGGIGADGEIEATGMQFQKWTPGGFMGENFKTKSGLPIINLPGCPCHGGVISGAIAALVSGIPLKLNQYNIPLEWYGTLVHQGCTRNEYHEYRVEEKKIGEKGCLFFYLGCHGPLVYGPCNKMLWNRRSSKTRVGVPCFGCTRPDFPQQYPFFKTRNIEGIPIELPDGVNRAHYLAYKGIAAAAAPERLKKRKTGI